MLLTDNVRNMRQAELMNRADRLLSLVQILRRHRYPVTAAALSRELGVSERTLYRDIATLQASGAPIRGEAGVGYVLDAGYDLPPLMFTPDELEALMLGARFVQERGDQALSRAAFDAVAKIEAVLPAALRPVFADSRLFAPGYRRVPTERVDISLVRRAIREGRKIDLAYADEHGQPTTRLIWPFALGYFDSSRVIVAWCELRKDFRHFRTDRVNSFTVLPERYPEHQRKLVARWEASRSSCSDQRSGETKACDPGCDSADTALPSTMDTAPEATSRKASG